MSSVSGVQEIQQTLHGYRNGHAPLASSFSLNSADRRKMLILSDLSGAKPVTGFDGYVSSYTLEDSGYYVFAKTWFATEMARPGCVWTHSLLLTKEQIASVSSLMALSNLFVRPKSEVEFDTFSLPVKFNFSDSSSQGSVSTLGLKLFSDVLTYPGKRLCYFANSEAEMHDAVFLASQTLWSSIRYKFSFCTGYLGTDLREMDPFSIIVVPSSNRRGFERAGSAVTIPQVSESSLVVDHSVSLQFMAKFGNELKPDLGISPTIILIGQQLSADTIKLDELVSNILVILDEKNEQSQLLKAVLGEVSDRLPQIDDRYEEDIFKFVVGAPDHILAKANVVFSSRLKKFILAHRGRGFALICDLIVDQNWNWHDFDEWSIFTQGLDLKSEIIRSDLGSELLAFLINLLPEKSKVLIHSQRNLEVVSFLRELIKLKPEPPLFSSVINVLISEGHIEGVASAAGVLGIKELVKILIYGSLDQKIDLSERVIRDLIQRNFDIFFDWVDSRQSLSEQQFLYVASICPPNSNVALNLFSKLIRNYPSHISEMSPEYRGEFSAYLLATLLEHRRVRDTEEVANIFSESYSAVISHHSSDFVYRVLQKSVPRGWGNPSLDERMRLLAFDLLGSQSISLVTFIQFFIRTGDVSNIVSSYKSLPFYTRWTIESSIKSESSDMGLNSSELEFLSRLRRAI